MFKITPNPPPLSSAEAIDPQAAERAFAHYNLTPGANPKPTRATPTRDLLPEAQSQEEALVNAYSILQSAAATAYENADNQTGANRKVAMGVVHLIELAQLWVNSVLDKRTADINS
ncbi:DUF6124 family protein [Pseudomonas batumici]|uniref:DUF3077 domain-containing protein n=1 Tax=Pseudomonas batumici TaxID=226910 RepID=A0A0C2EF38_9PSED|nr:hypothetical protein [Pseudomonas batumici]KIH84609.1 hypothetical protein UCMB321_1634 [Pseudomonas batumici]